MLCRQAALGQKKEGAGDWDSSGSNSVLKPEPELTSSQLSKSFWYVDTTPQSKRVHHMQRLQYRAEGVFVLGPLENSMKSVTCVSLPLTLLWCLWVAVFLFINLAISWAWTRWRVRSGFASMRYPIWRLDVPCSWISLIVVQVGILSQCKLSTFGVTVHILWRQTSTDIMQQRQMS